MSLLIKQFFWVPHRFRYGIIVAGGWGNVGDIPTSVVMSITGSAPFNGTDDQNLSVAYIAAFLLIFCITLFPMGGSRWIAMDYVGPDVENHEVQEMMRLKRKRLMEGWKKFFHWRSRQSQADLETPTETEPNENEKHMHSTAVELRPCTDKQLSFDGAAAGYTETMVPLHSAEAMSSQVTVSAAPTIFQAETLVQPHPLPSFSKGLSADPVQPVPPKDKPSIRKRILVQGIASLRSLLTPASLSIIISFIISVIPPLKALFVPGVPGTNISPAPDGQPPLAFLMNTATFIGAASVPLGLITLGSALARLKVPRNEWKFLPVGSIMWLAVGRMLVMPILGVLICQGLTNVGFIDENNNVLRFVCIFLSCLPTATTQVFLTQVYSGTGSAEHLSAFLIPQYILMFITMTALTAYTLQLLFH
ncbi:hypothetical protein SERLADRAFT_478030 [Serpula lacrymans var. lacrymans S7.9]|nr:uncharacterized protein SERLADRAFT_478030 [Serpula lacrymans var. lacrymans S7.9]EGO19763.1 hypothetical protein SERLADRAFT_478030 [Serpula lacrymans var. lacrymans S7.9]